MSISPNWQLSTRSLSLCATLLLAGISPAQSGPTLWFDGVDDSVEVATDPALDLANTYTLEAWVRPESTNRFHGILGRGTGISNGASDLNLNVWNDGRIALIHGANPWVISNTAILANVWSHVAVVVTPTDWTFYLNGVSDGNGAHATTLAPGSDPLYIGKQANLAGNYLHGALDDVRIWNSARAQSQIQAGMAGILHPTTLPDLVLDYEFSGTGQTVVDASSRGLDGFLGSNGSEENSDPFRWPSTMPPLLARPAGPHLHFDRCDGDRVTVPASGLLSLTNSYTLEAWVRPDEIGGHQAIFGRGTGGTHPTNYLLSVAPDGRVALSHGDHTTYNYYYYYPYYNYDPWVYSTSAIPAGEWTHVAVVVTPSTWRFYLNGVFDGAGSHAVSITPASHPLHIGQQGSLAANFWDGAMDEVCIWSSARTGSQVRGDATGISSPATEADLVAYYRFDGSGQSVIDSSANGLDGVLGTDVAAQATDPSRTGPIAAQSGDALIFNGCSEQVTVPHSPSLDLIDTYTLEAWVRPTQIGTFQSVLGRGSGVGSVSSVLFIVWNDGRLALTHGTNPWFLSNSTVVANEWTHVAVVVTPAGWEFFINGTADGHGAHSTSLAPTTAPLVIGRQGDSTNHFNGALDDVRIWRTARSPAEIQSAAIDLPNPVSEIDLVAYYRFNGTGQTVTDSSANGLHGFLGTGSSVENRDPERAFFARGATMISAISQCPPGHHALGGPVLTAIAGSGMEVTIEGRNLGGTGLCGLMIGNGMTPLPLSVIGVTTPGAALCIDAFGTYACVTPSTTFQRLLPFAVNPAVRGLNFDVQLVDWTGSGMDIGTSAALRLTVGW